MLRKRSDLLSEGGVGTVGIFFSDEYAGGGDLGGAMPSCGCCTLGASGAALVGGAGASRDGSGGGACDGTTTNSVRREDERRRDAGPLLSSFMRLVESVRRNCVVKSAAQFGGRGSCEGGGTGFRLGTPLLWPSMVNVVLLGEWLSGSGGGGGRETERECVVFGVAVAMLRFG